MARLPKLWSSLHAPVRQYLCTSTTRGSLRHAESYLGGIVVREFPFSLKMYPFFICQTWYFYWDEPPCQSHIQLPGRRPFAASLSSNVMLIDNPPFMASINASWLLLGAVICMTIVESIRVVVYRLYFHPLAHIPGPLLARASFFYAYSYESRGGQFYLQIQKLHQKYGPVVRITPNEIHLSDPENCEKIYHVGSRFRKDPSFYGFFGADTATFATLNPDVHRVRRAALNPFFSRRKTLELEEIMQQKAKKLVSRMQSAFDITGQIELHCGFRAVSVDVITDYALDNSYELLSQDDFGKGFFDLLLGAAIMGPFFRQFPIFYRASLATPLWLAKLFSESLSQLLTYEEDTRGQIRRVKAAVDNGEKSVRTIFHQLLQPDAADGHVVPTVEALSDEATSVLAAAGDTTGHTLTIASYNIVTNPEIYQRLSGELKEAFPDVNDDIKFTSLEKLPYLTGVIKESLRLGFGVPGRLPRVVPEPGAEFNGYVAPAGTVVSMSSWTMHHDETLFPNAEEFDPTRWTDPATSKALEKYLFSFGKGSRQCIGMQLAYCELYVTLGRVFRQFDNLKTRKRSQDELLLEDWFTSHHQEKYRDFFFEQAV